MVGQGEKGHMDNSIRAQAMPDEAPVAAPSGATLDFKQMTEHCNAYKGADLKKSLWQLFSTSALFFSNMAAIFAAAHYGHYFLTFLLMIPAGLLLIRMFIIQHDCGHGSFFNQKWANDLVGRAISVLTFTPYDLWRRTHNLHHAGSGNLDRRGSGSVDTLTVKEYQAMSPGRQRFYRFYRHPLTLLVFGPPLYVLFFQRFPPAKNFLSMPKYHTPPTSQTLPSVLGLNLAMLACYGVAGYFLGYAQVAIIYPATLVMAYWPGQWLFFMQHQFEDTHWEYGPKWSYAEAAVMGSSYYKLPKILQWFTGNIGFHHIHHLNASIPNYKLEDCHNAYADFEKVNTLNIRQSLKCANLALWDEDSRKMIRFKDLPPKLKVV